MRWWSSCHHWQSDDGSDGVIEEDRIVQVHPRMRPLSPSLSVRHVLRPPPLRSAGCASAHECFRSFAANRRSPKRVANCPAIDAHTTATATAIPVTVGGPPLACAGARVSSDSAVAVAVGVDTIAARSFAISAAHACARSLAASIAIPFAARLCPFDCSRRRCQPLSDCIPHARTIPLCPCHPHLRRCFR